MYKLVAKVLADRLKCVRDKCILDNQFAFVLNIFILDNVMSMIEIVHFFSQKKKQRLYTMKSKNQGVIRSYDSQVFTHSFNINYCTLFLFI